MSRKWFFFSYEGDDTCVNPDNIAAVQLYQSQWPEGTRDEIRFVGCGGEQIRAFGGKDARRVWDEWKNFLEGQQQAPS